MRAMTVGPANQALPAKRFGALAAILVIAAAILAIGCFDKGSKPKTNDNPLPGYLPPTSPENVVANLKKSWSSLDYGAYATVLGAEFTYVFAPQDVGGPNNLPETWGTADELLSAHNLFGKTDVNRDGYVADTLWLAFTAGPAIPNDMEGWTKIVLTNIFLTVRTHNQTTHDPLDYLVQGDQAYLWFADHGGTWTLVRWEDKPIAGLGVRPSTWGAIKELFR